MDAETPSDIKRAVQGRKMMMGKFVQTLCTTAALTMSMTIAASAAEMQKLDERIEAAHAVLHELMDTPDKGIPNDIAAKATCIAVVPGFKREPLSSAASTARA
ncbi:hypothetical protein [Tunturiibacter gelidiferens]|uniref:hypothetical protein n=1 Tax=Tunturiibacter gelidiferens TaxID=3069689 RepID=UPI003D9BB864